MDVQEAIKNRYSVRSFAPERIEDEKLEQILEAGRLAPTAKNIQPQHIYVLQSPEALEKVDKATPCRFHAGTVLVVCSDRSKAWVNPFDASHDTANIDATIIADHMILAAWELGIGSCWVGYFDPAVISKALALPEDRVPVILIPLGYPADDAAPSDRHQKRKALEEFVTRI